MNIERLLRFAGVMVGLGLAGGLLDCVAKPLRGGTGRGREKLENSPGAGAVWGWLGGFRGLAADLLWLKMHARWEVRDLGATEALIGFTSGVDPRPLYFWLNGARIVAYDFPAWRIEADGGYKAVPTHRQGAIDAEQAKRALVRIAEARKVLPQSAELWVEQANIELNRLKDAGAAAESYRQAALQPGAPYYAARLHGELLKRMGRKAEAYAWLRARHPALPREEEAAAWELVLGRIRELERELAIPRADVYQPRHE
jgi:hypothetical protein